MPTPIHVSVVSHGHGALVRDLLLDLGQETGAALEVTVTLNVAEPLVLDPAASPFPLSIVENAAPRSGPTTTRPSPVARRTTGTSVSRTPTCAWSRACSRAWWKRWPRILHEDVDVCCRAHLAGYDVLLDEAVCVTHDGLWDSHRNPRYLRWHLASMARFFWSGVCREAGRHARARAARAAAWRAGALAQAPSEREGP